MSKFSRNDVVRAGRDLINAEILNDNIKFAKTMEVLTFWRESHIEPLNRAEKLLKNTAIKLDKNAFIAKRIKRLPSIKKKLIRFEGMQLKNMNDIAGIRIVLSDLAIVNKLYLQLSHQQCFKNEDGAFIRIDNYITHPKDDGYRCLHMIGKFENEENEDRKVEFQLRTRLQHSWATTLEIIDIFTSQDLKSNNGLLAWSSFFKDVSEQFQIIENLESFSLNAPSKLVKEYIQKIHKDSSSIKQCIRISHFISQNISGRTLEQHLEEYCNLLETIEIPQTNHNSFVLIRLNTKVNSLASEFYSLNEKDMALEHYSQYEQTLSNNKDWVIALLATDAIGGLRQAYPNYFADSNFFLQYISLIKLVINLIVLARNK